MGNKQNLTQRVNSPARDSGTGNNCGIKGAAGRAIIWKDAGYEIACRGYCQYGLRSTQSLLN